MHKAVKTKNSNSKSMQDTATSTEMQSLSSSFPKNKSRYLNESSEDANMLAELKYSIENRLIDPFLPDEAGLFPLHYAAAEGYLSSLQFLVQLGCNPTITTTTSNQSALHLAAGGGHLAIVDYLTKFIARSDHLRKKIQPINQEGQNPLHLASRNGHVRVVEYLVREAHYDPLLFDQSGMTGLHLAALSGHLEVVSFYLRECRLSPHLRTQSGGYTPLILAAGRGQLDVVKLLVETSQKESLGREATGSGRLGNVLFETNEIGDSPLHVAAMNGSLEVVQYLMEQSGNLSLYSKLVNKSGVSSLRYAVRYGHENIANYLAHEPSATYYV
jgi:ankyrin repeat protein